MKREKLNLGEKVAVICEGGAETAIMELLLDAGRLIFKEILSSLGKMYAGCGEFTENIDKMDKRLKVAREKAEKHNAEVKNLVVERRKGKGIVL